MPNVSRAAGWRRLAGKRKKGEEEGGEGFLKGFPSNGCPSAAGSGKKEEKGRKILLSVFSCYSRRAHGEREKKGKKKLGMVRLLITLIGARAGRREKKKKKGGLPLMPASLAAWSPIGEPCRYFDDRAKREGGKGRRGGVDHHRHGPA